MVIDLERSNFAFGGVNMKVLLICDDLWHPGETVRYGLNFLTEKGHVLDVVMDAKDIVTLQLLREYDAVIIAKGNALNGANAQAPWFEEGITYVDPNGYKKYVEEGGAILVMHAGATYTSERCPSMSAFLGTRFITHPPQCPVEFKVANANHLIMEDIHNFTFPQDEHYQIEILDERLEVFAQTSSPAGTFPAGLSREYGNGRLCILTPGHNAFAINYPEYQKVLLNALDWITKRT